MHSVSKLPNETVVPLINHFININSLWVSDSMDEIRDIVVSIVRGCAQGGTQVSEVLAAYVARTVRL